MPTLLETRELTAQFGGLQVLDYVNIAVEEGTVTGLIGPNGAGKTTVFNVICGFVKPDKGSVIFENEIMRHTKPHSLTHMGISRTLQGVGLFPSLNALENVMLGATNSVKTGIISESFAAPWADAHDAKTRELALEVMAELGVADVAKRRPPELPYPVQKRISLARALVSDPKLLMLDEPAGGVGADDIAELSRLIRSWTPKRTVLLVEHHMELVMDVCDYIWVLDAGRVIAGGTPSEVRNDPAVLAAYLGQDAVH